MSQREKRLSAARNNPIDVRFTDLLALAEDHGFQIVRQSSSHVILKHRRLQQPFAVTTGKNGKAHAYQVRKILGWIAEFGEDEPPD